MLCSIHKCTYVLAGWAEIRTKNNHQHSNLMKYLHACPFFTLNKQVLVYIYTRFVYKCMVYGRDWGGSELHQHFPSPPMRFQMIQRCSICHASCSPLFSCPFIMLKAFYTPCLILLRSVYKQNRWYSLLPPATSHSHVKSFMHYIGSLWLRIIHRNVLRPNWGTTSLRYLPRKPFFTNTFMMNYLSINISAAHLPLNIATYRL